MPQTFPKLHANGVTLLCADQTALAGASQAGVYLAWLDSAEQARLQRFRRQIDAEMFLLGRALLRWSLAQMTGVSPAEVEICIDAQGKPSCPDWHGHAFNLSHSAGKVVLALAPAAAVGVDLEYCDRALDWSAIASEHFAATELEEIAALPADERPGRFYRYWTLKEAYGKAQGRGIVSDLRRMNFLSAGGHRYRHVDPEHHSGDFIWAADFGEHHALALAVVDRTAVNVNGMEIWQLLPGLEVQRFELRHGCALAASAECA